ncbi:hypothetical protein TA3x_003811 [Tundrisphaera sp. TA3]|uniref:hypothetical protein n=1 Tax=Tundrisphaera sp. TA3 TaxID=3435775 RepID=UPI003EBFE967
MQGVPPSHAALSVLRDIARSGFSYAPTKALAEAAGWDLRDDEPGLGYVRFDRRMTAESDEGCPLSVMVNGGEHPPFAYVTLAWFEDYEVERGPFDEMFRIPYESLTSILGESSQSGHYHQVDWDYSFAGWTLPDCTLILVQDELDIQFGMDVSLWALPAGRLIALPVYDNLR